MHYDKVFCVFDKDNHDSYQRTLDAIKILKNYEAINSVSCFEFWLLLHYKLTTSPYYSSSDPCKRVIIDLKKFDPNYSKSSFQSFSNYLEKTEYAINNAEKVLKDNLICNTDDPSTHVHELVIFLENMSDKINN